MEGLALSPTGALFGTDNQGHLYNLSTSTGSATLIGDTHLGDIEGLSFSGTTLVGTNFHNPTTFYSIDTTSASVTALVTTSPAEGPFRDMSVENSTTALAVSDTPSFQTLISTDLGTGATSSLGSLGSSFFAAIDFGPGGTLYGLDGSGNEYLINPTNAALDLVGHVSTAGGSAPWTGLAIQSVPEPSTWISASIGLLVVTVWSMRKAGAARGKRVVIGIEKSA